MPISKKDNKKIKLQPSVNLYHAVVGSFRAQGNSFANWCNQNEINRENARAALHGIWRGPKADIVIDKILTAADRETILFLLKKRKDIDHAA